jgi:hypothetical protein
MMLVFANSSTQATSWARAYGLKPHVYRFVGDYDDVRGYLDNPVVILPKWRASNGQQEAMAYLRAMGALA